MIDSIIGIVLVVTAAGVVLREWLASQTGAGIAAVGCLLFLVIATPRVRWSRQTFVGVGLVLAAIAIVTREDWQEIIVAGLEQGAFIAAFFIALASLRNPASQAPSIERCGQYLASQPPGKRYLSLTAGGHLFALILNYGSISLLGGLTEAIAMREPNAEIREIRNRRMLLAIQRGFIASLTWSPLAFAMAISTSLIPGSSWGGAAPFAIINAVLITFIGWALDSIYKPTLTGPRPARREAIGSWRDLKPLVLLLLLLFASVSVLEVATGLRIIAIVMVLVPLISVAWIVIQTSGMPQRSTHVARRLKGMILLDFPSYKGEVVLLVMAGIIGSIGGALLGPLIAGQSGFLDALPGWLILGSLVWIIPILGQCGMNPILSVSLFAPLLPSADAMGVSANAVVAALTAGWAITGATSPFTATTLLVGRLGHISALKVGLIWNRSFVLIAGAALSISVAIISFL